MAKIFVVDKNDEVIETKERSVLVPNDIYRVSALWVVNSAGKILLAQRAFTKSHSPGKWGPAVAGTVEEGEDYDSNIIKEAEEELGLKDIEIKKDVKVFIDNEHKYFVQVYTAVVDKSIEEFVIQKSEVAALNWFDEVELINDVKAHPEKYVSGIAVYLLSKK